MILILVFSWACNTSNKKQSKKTVQKNLVINITTAKYEIPFSLSQFQLDSITENTSLMDTNKFKILLKKLDLKEHEISHWFNNALPFWSDDWHQIIPLAEFKRDHQTYFLLKTYEKISQVNGYDENYWLINPEDKTCLKIGKSGLYTSAQNIDNDDTLIWFRNTTSTEVSMEVNSAYVRYCTQLQYQTDSSYWNGVVDTSITELFTGPLECKDVRY